MWKTPLLAKNDTNPKKRQKEMDKEQEKYRYKYTYQSLEGVAMADGTPLNKLPNISWILKVINIAGKLAKNASENTVDDEKKDIFKDEKVVVKDLDNVKVLLSNFDEENTEALDTVLKKFSTRIDTQRPKDLSDYNAFFETLSIPKISKNFQDDDAFVRMRVAGQNPVMLTCIKDIETAFPIDDDIFQSIKGFEEDSLVQAQTEQRLYMIDYKALENVENGHNDAGQKYSYAPKALFAIDKNEKQSHKALKAIGILCGQTLSETSPLFTPHDGYAWQIAKTIVEIADFNYHELITHLGGTHLVIEPFVVSTHDNLPKDTL
jgi:arachidonate 15-lipoxygenase